jgi:nucleoside permease NupC
MLTPAGLVVALILSAPALWEAANGSLSLGVAMLRLLAALVLVAVGTAVLRRVMAPQRPMAPPVTDEVSSAANHGRRRDDS